MIAKHIQCKKIATTSRDWHLHESWDMCTDTSVIEGLSETIRPDLIPTMRSDHSEKRQWFVPQDPVWDILFLRLKGTHLDTQDGVFDGGHYALLRVKTKLFNVTRDLKCPLEVFKRLSPCDVFLCDPVLSRDDDSVGSVLSPQIRLKESVNLWNKEGSSLLLLRNTMLGIAPRTSPHPRKSWGRHTVLTVVLG